MIKRIVALFDFIIICQTVFAQDQLFSQFYNLPLHLNPAFTGCARNDTRICGAVKTQWIGLGLGRSIKSFSLSADKNLPGTRFSYGGTANQYTEGYIKTTDFSGVGAINFGGKDGDYCYDWFFSFAAQASFVFSNANRDRFLFPDQIDQNGINGQASQAEVFIKSKNYMDISFGCLGTYRKFMVGLAAYHLSQPNNGLIGNTDAGKLPYRLTFHVSYINDKDENENERECVFKPTFILQQQDVSRQISLGSMIDIKRWPLQFGIWYNNSFTKKSSHSISFAVNIDLFGKDGGYTPEPLAHFRSGLGYQFDGKNLNTGDTKGSYFLSGLYELSTTSECPTQSGLCNARYPWEFH